MIAYILGGGGFNRRFRAKFSGEERVDEFLFFFWKRKRPTIGIVPRGVK